MDPIVLGLVRIGAVSFGVIGGFTLANTTPSWDEDSARENLPIGWHRAYYWHSDVFLAGSCLSSIFGHSGANQSLWLSRLIQAIPFILAIVLAYIGWPAAEDLTGSIGGSNVQSLELLCAPGTWILLGSMALGYVTGILLRKPVT